MSQLTVFLPPQKINIVDYGNSVQVTDSCINMDNLHKQLLYPRAIALQIFVMHLLEISLLNTSYHISAKIKQPKMAL